MYETRIHAVRVAEAMHGDTIIRRCDRQDDFDGTYRHSSPDAPFIFSLCHKERVLPTCISVLNANVMILVCIW